MSDHSSLINRICFEQVKPNKTPKIEPTEAIELLNEENVIIETGEESEKLNLDQKFYLNEFKLMNGKLAFILDNQIALKDHLLDLRKLQKGIILNSCIICVDTSILVVILIVLKLPIYGIYLLNILENNIKQ